MRAHSKTATSTAQKAMLAACAIVATPTLAQNSSGPETASAAAETSNSSRADLLEEVLVTARRRAEVQTEVPVSITAYSADFLQKQNIRSFADYATKIPNLSFQYGAGGGTGFSEGRAVTIRGVAGANTTAFYINDTPVPSAVTPQTLNLERIEVLKGPQGTLFGASSMGGNLRYITSKPSLTENSLSTEVGAGTTKDGGTDADVNGRGSLVLIPDRLAMDVAAGYARESGFLTRRFPDASGAPISKDDQGRDETWSASLSMRAALTDRLEASVGFLGQKSELDGLPVAYTPLPQYRVVSYTLDRDRDVQEYSKDRWGLGSFVLDYQGDAFSIISSTSYFSRKVEEMSDSTEAANDYIEEVYGDRIGDPAWRILSIDNDRQFTHETRVSFDEGALLPKLSGVAGVFHQRNTSRPYNPAIFVPELAASGLFDGGFLASVYGHNVETQTALFGEIYYEVVPKLTVTLGLRRYRIKQDIGEEVDTGLLFDDGSGGPLIAIIPARHGKQTGTVPKAVLSYEIGDRGTVYASAAKGFRVGGTQSPLPDACDQDLADLGFANADIRSYESDSLWSYEVGAKNNFADGRIAVSAAAFQIDWSKIQQQIVLPGCTFGFTANAGKARIRGAEFEVSGQPLAELPLTMQLGVGYEHGVLIDPGLIPQAPNTELVQTPRWTSTLSGYYETQLSANTALFAAADYGYTSTLKSVDGQGQGGFVTRQSLNMVNGNVGVRFGQTEIRLYGRNLLDKRLNYGDLFATGFERQEVSSDGTVRRYPQSAVSRPRQFGVQVSTEF
jgi:iron complex outermembrane recepter protein